MIRKLTIPPCDDEEYNHDLTIIWPFFGLLFLAWNFTKPSFWWFFIFPIAFGLSLLFCKYRKLNVDELPPYYIWINILGIFCSVLWVRLASGILIDLLTFVGMLTNLSSSYLGLTIIAIGNALPDGLTTISIAKSGYASLALTGGIVG